MPAPLARTSVLALGVVATVLAGSLAAEEAAAQRDYAALAQRDDWLHHPVLGEPSWDAFARVGERPFVRGAPPLPWPVNGSLFVDPPTGDWYAYVGFYNRGYAIAAPPSACRCRVYRSRDRGLHWDDVGWLFPEDRFELAGVRTPIIHAPDVTVVFHQGRYHLTYDWASAGCTWENAQTPTADSDSGIGYAWSDSPAGPFHRSPRPLVSNCVFSRAPLNGKYGRAYGGQLIPRAHDWLLLGAADSGRHYGWSLIVATGSRPDGPFGAPVGVLDPDLDRYLPAPLEFFPQFVHEGMVYAPATSVAMNRDFCCLFSAPIEHAHRPEAWQLVKEGSLWHAERNEAEHHGLWGQTFAGAFDGDDFVALFPSRDRADCGTIGIARRSWRVSDRDDGFVLSAHGGPAAVPLRWSYGDFACDAELDLAGTATIAFGWHVRIGPDATRADACPHRLTSADLDGVELTSGTWRVISVDAAGARTVVAEGTHAAAMPAAVRVERTGDEVSVAIAGTSCWHGRMATTQRGCLGLLLAPDSHLRVRRFAVAGARDPAVHALLANEGILGAADAGGGWAESVDARFRFGVGAVRGEEGGRVKFDFHGTGFTWWSPCGPDGAAVEAMLDGRRLQIVDLRSAQARRSTAVLARDNLPDGPHALVLRVTRGRLALDSVDVECVAPAAHRGAIRQP